MPENASDIEGEERAPDHTATLIDSPIELFEPYPGLTERFSVDLDGLMESIHSNGQLEPVKAVRRETGKGYWVVDGRRRLASCQRLRSEYGEPTRLQAIVVDRLPEESIFLRAILTNVGDKNQRKNLSLLEEIAVVQDMVARFGDRRALELTISSGRNRSTAVRLLELAKAFPREDLGALYSIERSSGSQFTLAHLEDLILYREDRATLLKVAAISSKRRIAPAQINVMTLDQVLDYYFPGFRELFPLLSGADTAPVDSPRTEQDHRPSSSSSSSPSPSPHPPPMAGTADVLEPGMEESSATQEPELLRGEGLHPEGLEVISHQETSIKKKQQVLAEDVYLASCCHCGAPNPFQMQTEQAVQVTFIAPREDGNPQKETVIPTTVHVDRVCSGCKRQFSIVVSWKGHGKLAIATHRRSSREPEAASSAGLLVLDSNQPPGSPSYPSQAAAAAVGASSPSPQTVERPSWFYIGPDVKKRL